jgi:hypothetical protein
MLYTNSAQQLLDDIELIFISTFIGCCCDSRRAVLIFNIINLILNLLYILYYVGMGSAAYLGAWWAYIIVGLVIISLTITGAALYNKWLVILGALWAVIELIYAFVVNGAQGRSFVVVVNGEVYAYPIVSLIWAIIWQGLVLYVSCWSLGILLRTICDYSHTIFLFPTQLFIIG